MAKKHTGLELAAQALWEEAQSGKVSAETLQQLKDERGKKK